MAETISGSLRTWTTSDEDNDWINFSFSLDFSALVRIGWNEVIETQSLVSFPNLTNSGLS